MLNYIRMLRPYQWYKNLVVFLALVFSWNLFSTDLFLSTLVGFISLSLASSAGYIINDIADRKKDIIHPVKKKRPIASGKISPDIALIISVMLLASSLLIAIALNSMFTMLIIGMFAFTLFYTFVLKKIKILDIVGIGINFVIRAVSGAIIIGVYISPWLVLCPFFISLFLSAAKRKGDLEVAKTLSIYKEDELKIIVSGAMMFLLASYIVYMINVNLLLLFTLPFAIFVVFRYYYFMLKKTDIIRNPNLAFKDITFSIGTLLWIGTTLLVLYL